MRARPQIAIVGAGVGGLALAAALTPRGFDVRVFEQAREFRRIGAGIQQSPNAVKVLGELGLGPALRGRAFVPATMTHRDGVTGEISNEVMLGAAAEERYGAPYLLLHRGDLHERLLSTLPAGTVVHDKRLVGFERHGDRVALAFADGGSASADALVAADGVHSVVRETILGSSAPRFSGKVGYRAIFPAQRLGDEQIADNTKWWGADRHLIVYFTTASRNEVYVMGTLPEPDFDLESWSATGDLDVFRDAYADFHSTVRRILDGVSTVHKWALVDREPLSRWSDGNVVLLGDAAHPMMPHMGQGAAMAIEDVAVLVRCVEDTGAGQWRSAFARFERTRKERTTEMQQISAGNSFARSGRDAVDWVYGYDAWSAPLAPPAEVAGGR